MKNNFRFGDWVEYKDNFGIITKVTDEYVVISCGDMFDADQVYVYEHEYKHIKSWCGPYKSIL